MILDTASPQLDAREALLQARRLLLEPSARNIALCLLSLAAAEERTEGLAARLRRSKPCDRALLSAALALRQELRTISALLEKTASFRAGSPPGKPEARLEEAEPEQRISVRH